MAFALRSFVLAASLKATALGPFLKVSGWSYPLVNAGHILGIALLIDSVIPMDLRLLGDLCRDNLDQGSIQIAALQRPARFV